VRSLDTAGRAAKPCDAADLPNPIAPASRRCKCCVGEARLYGVVDFHNNRANAERFKEPSGIAIYYHRRRACGFLFTVAFGSFFFDDFSKWVYNAEYGLVDPEYAQTRPRHMAAMVGRMSSPSKQIRAQDYGGGRRRNFIAASGPLS